EAVAFILSLIGDPPQLIPTPPPAPPRPGPSVFHHRASNCSGGNLAVRIAAYSARLPHLREGQGRPKVAFGFGAWLVRDLALADSLALEWLERWDGGNSPPLGRERLAEILNDAHQYGRNPVGCGRTVESGRRVCPARRVGHSVISFTVE